MKHIFRPLTVNWHPDRLAFWVLFVGVLILPLVIFPWFGLGLDFAKKFFLIFVVLVAAALWLVDLLHQGQMVFPRSRLLPALGAVIGVMALAASLTTAPAVSWLGIGYERGTVLSFLIFGALLVLASVLFRTKKDILNFYFALIMVGALVLVWQILYLTSGALFNWPVPNVLFKNGATNLIGKWNDFGIFLGLLALVATILLELFGSSLSPRLKYFMRAVLVVSLGFLALINFPSIWWCLGAITLALFIYLTIFRRQHQLDIGAINRLIFRPTLVVAVICFLFLIIGRPLVLSNNSDQGPTGLGALISRLNSRLGISTLEVRPAWSSTLAVARPVWQSSPLFGLGPERFSIAWAKWRPLGINDTPFWASDFSAGFGLLPTMIITTGLFGVLAWLWFLAVFVYELASIVWRPPAEDRITHSLMILSGTTALYLWLMTLVYVSDTIVLALTFTSTGLLVAVATLAVASKTYNWSFNTRPRLHFLAIIGGIVLLLACLIGGYLVGEKAWAALSFQRGLQVITNGGAVDQAETLVARAARLDSQDIYWRTLVSLELAKLDRLLKTTGEPAEKLQAEFQATLSQAIAAGQQAITADPEFYVNWLTLGNVYEQLLPLNIPGAYEQATNTYQEALKRNPNQPQILFILARLALAKNDSKLARDYLTQALAKKRDFTDAIFLLAQLDLDAGNLAGAIDYATTATAVAPANPGAWLQLGFLRYQTGAYVAARDALLKALVLNSNFANAKYFLGLSYDRLGNRDLALAEFADLAKTNPDSKEVAQIITNLKAGRPALSNSSNSPDKKGRPPVAEN